VKSKVYPTQTSPKHDLSKALQFGDLMPCLTSADYAGSNTTYAKIRAMLAQFDSKVDFLLPIGDPVNIGLAFTALYRMGHNKVRVLKWHRVKAKYQPVLVVLDQIPWAPERQSDDE
jgi:hypothetical protein